MRGTAKRYVAASCIVITVKIMNYCSTPVGRKQCAIYAVPGAVLYYCIVPYVGVF